MLFLLGILITSLATYYLLFQPRPNEKPVPKEMGMDLGYAIETSINDGNPEILNEAFSHFAYLEKIAGMLRFGNRRLVSRFAIELKEQLKLGEIFTSDILDAEGHFKFTQLYTDSKNRTHLIFRLYSLDNYNIFDFELAWVRGEVKIVDAFIFSDGEEMSKMAYESIRSSSKQRFYTSAEKTYESVLSLKQKIEELKTAGAYEEAYLKLQNAPKAFKSDFIFQNLQLSVYSYVPEYLDQFELVFNEVKKSHPEAKVYIYYWDFIYQSFKKDGPKLQSAVENLKSVIGEDPIFNLFEGQAFFYEKRFLQATEKFDLAIEEYPFITDIYWWKLESLVAGQNYQKAVEWLDFMVALFDLTEVDVEEIMNTYPDFANSKSYYKWRGFKNI